MKKTLVIEPQIVQSKEKQITLLSNIKGTNEIKNLSFQFEKRYKNFLVTKRQDAFLVRLLPWAMEQGYDIECTQPIYRELLFQIREYLIPIMYKNNPKFSNIKIYAEPTDTIISIGHCYGATEKTYSLLPKKIKNDCKHIIRFKNINSKTIFNECSNAIALQPLISKWIYAMHYSLEEFQITSNDFSQWALTVLDTLSTRAMVFQPLTRETMAWYQKHPK